MLAEVYLSPQYNAILPPFTSKVGKTMLNNPPKSVSVSPLKYKGKYLIKRSNHPIYIEVEGDKIYSFEIGGRERDVMETLMKLEEREVFNTVWRVKDIRTYPIEVGECRSFELHILTPALLTDPMSKSKRKRFTNRPSVVFFTNILEEFGVRREDPDLTRYLENLDSSLWEEPSFISYSKVYYEDKLVVGLTGLLRYSITTNEGIVRKILTNAIARGIGSSRRNGFGRVRVNCQ